MKNKFISHGLLAVGVLSLSFSINSCEKETVDVEQEVEISENEINDLILVPVDQGGPSQDRLWKPRLYVAYDMDGRVVAYDCLDSGGKCEGKSTVNESILAAPIINDAIDLIQSADHDGVMEHFTIHETRINEVIAPHLVEGVVSGELTVESFGEYEEGSYITLLFYETGHRYYGAIQLTPVH